MALPDSPIPLLCSGHIRAVNLEGFEERKAKDLGGKGGDYEIEWGIGFASVPVSLLLLYFCVKVEDARDGHFI